MISIAAATATGTIVRFSTGNFICSGFYSKELVEAGKVRPVVDRVYILQKIIEALR
jgi:hypothetical protein